MENPVAIKVARAIWLNIFRICMHNKKFALRELVFNAYDADADWVKIIFQDFDKDFNVQPQSRITIHDNGSGISKSLLEKWFVPGESPKSKAMGASAMTSESRVIRGGGGIGRFYIFSLGRKINITTNSMSDSNQYIFEYELPECDYNYMVHSQGQLQEYTYAYLATRKTDNNCLKNGSVIEISCLTSGWNELVFEGFYEKMMRRMLSLKGTTDFALSMYKDDKRVKHIVRSHNNRLSFWWWVIGEHIRSSITKFQIIVKNLFAGKL